MDTLLTLGVLGFAIEYTLTKLGYDVGTGAESLTVSLAVPILKVTGYRCLTRLFVFSTGTWMLVVQAVFLRTSIWGESSRHM